ncbi:MAG: peptidase Ste24p [Rhodocyclales bacterium]|nr:peptidase Ste24p [Rhodocyclales bacterium]
MPPHMRKPASCGEQRGKLRRPQFAASIFTLIGSLLAAALLATGISTNASALPAAAPASIDTEAREQQIFETHLYLADLTRLERVAYALLKSASPYCIQNRKYSLGVPPVSSADLPEDLRAGFVAMQEGGAGNPRFLQVLSGSPIWSAGIRDGEQLVSITDLATGKTVAPAWVFNRPASTLATNVGFKVEVGNATDKHVLEVKPQLICVELPRLVRQDELMARISAGTMTVSTGLLRFVRNDDELALLLANELAHSILPKSTRATQRWVSSKTRSTFPPEEERSADYLGAYIAALGRFDPENAKDIWRRIAGNAPSRVIGGIAHRHPFTSERAVWQRATLVEIRRKNLTGLQLVPDRKSLPPNLHTDFAAADDPFAQNAQAVTKDVDVRLNRVADVPFINSEGRSGYQRFLNTPLRPRAFAVGRGGPASIGVWSYKVGSNAVGDALKTCAVANAGVACYLYAIDDRVVWNPETAARMPQPSGDDLDPRLSLVADVPFLSSEGRKGYERFLNTSVRPRAFVLGPNGSGGAAWAYRTGANASADALAYCAVLTRGRPCYLYAVDDRVVWDMENAPISPMAAQADPDNGSGSFSRPSASGFADIRDVAAVPLSQDQLMTYRAFLEKPAPRAFVITQEGFGRYWLGPAAMENALSYCERLGEPCWLYAVDDDVVWQAEKTKRLAKRIQLPKQSDELQFLK